MVRTRGTERGKQRAVEIKESALKWMLPHVQAELIRKAIEQERDHAQVYVRLATGGRLCFRTWLARRKLKEESKEEK